MQETATRLLFQAQTVEPTADTSHQQVVEDLLTVACDSRFQALVDERTDQHLKSVLVYLSKHQARIRRRGISHSKEDVAVVAPMGANDAFASFTEKGGSKFEMSLTTTRRNKQLWRVCLNAMQSDLVVVVVDCSFLVEYFAKQQGSLQWNSQVKVAKIVDSLFAHVSRLIAQSPGLEFIRLAVEDSLELSVVLSSFRTLQKTLDSKFGIVLSGVVHLTHPYLARQLADFVIDEFRRQSCGNFNVMCAELDKRDSTIGKQIRKEVLLAKESGCDRTPSTTMSSTSMDSPRQPQTPLDQDTPFVNPIIASLDEGSESKFMARSNTDETFVDMAKADFSMPRRTTVTFRLPHEA